MSHAHYMPKREFNNIRAWVQRYVVCAELDMDVRAVDFR
jgi:hypothetical protein